MRKSRFISILAAMVLAGSVSAQPVQGDLVLTSQGSAAGVYFLSGTSMVLRTLLPNFVTSGVKTTHNNGSVHVIGGNTGNIYKLDARGSLYTITTSTPQGGAAMELDQDGSYMVVNSFNRILYRLQGNSPFVYLTLTSSHGSPNAICRDGNTGDWIIGTTMNGRLYRVNRETREITTLYSGSAMSSIFGVAFMPQTGEFAVVRSRMGYTTLFEELAIIRSSGSVHYTRQIENAGKA